jgi:hypothetical protein
MDKPCLQMILVARPANKFPPPPTFMELEFLLPCSAPNECSLRRYIVLFVTKHFVTIQRSIQEMLRPDITLLSRRDFTVCVSPSGCLPHLSVVTRNPMLTLSPTEFYCIISRWRGAHFHTLFPCAPRGFPGYQIQFLQNSLMRPQ